MIETFELARYFGALKAVDGVSFKVGKGEVLGFLGPNGAGKSTTMKMLTCFLSPSSGTAKVGGYDIVENPREVRKLIGYLPENAPLYGEMTVKSFLTFVAEVRELKGTALTRALERVIECTNLRGVVEQKIETLSKGFKRRVGLAQALVHDPEILVLDEPTDGLDPNQKHDVRELINSMSKNKCIILSTHILEEVEAVCSRVVIIAKGKVVADALPDELKTKSRRAGAVRLGFKSRPEDAVISAIRKVSGVAEIIEETRGSSAVNLVLLSKSGVDLFRSVVAESQKNNWSYDSLQLESGSLDEVFRNMTT